MSVAIALLALLVALAALGVAAVAYRKADDAVHDAHTHPKPPRERRDLDLGPPRAVGERRGAHRPPDEQPEGNVDAVEPTTGPVEVAPRTVEHAPPTRGIDLSSPPPPLRPSLPPPGQIGMPPPGATRRR